MDRRGPSPLWADLFSRQVVLVSLRKLAKQAITGQQAAFSTVSSSSSFPAWVADLTSLYDELGPGSVEINPSSPALLVLGMFYDSDREETNVDTYRVHL